MSGDGNQKTKPPRLPKRIERIRIGMAWNLDDFLELLRWLLFHRGRLFAFPYRHQDEAMRHTGAWMFGTLLWLPFLIIALALALQTLPRSQAWGIGASLVLLVIIAWGVTARLGKGTREEHTQKIEAVMVGSSFLASGCVTYFAVEAFQVAGVNFSPRLIVFVILSSMSVFFPMAMIDLCLNIVKVADTAQPSPSGPRDMDTDTSALTTAGNQIVPMGIFDGQPLDLLIIPVLNPGHLTNYAIAGILMGFGGAIGLRTAMMSSATYVPIFMSEDMLFVLCPLALGLFPVLAVRHSISQHSAVLPLTALLSLPITHIALVWLCLLGGWKLL